MKIEKFPRQKSTIGFVAAKYPMLILYALTAAWMFLPFVGPLAWLIPMLTFAKEKDSKYLRLHAAQAGFLALIWSILTLVLGLIGDFITLFAVRSRNDAAIIQAALTNEGLSRGSDILRLIVVLLFVIELVLGYQYRFWALPVLGKWAKRLHDRTDPGPLR